MSIPRPEYPRPQFSRELWMNLNGTWEFQIDNEKSGEAKEFYNLEHLSGSISVPFCPESKLSGVTNKDFMACVWYKRRVSLTSEQLKKRVLIHFGAVDYLAVLYVNGQKAGTHKGGYSSFFFDITELLKEGENDITLCAYDDTRSFDQPTGKQSKRFHPIRCCYTRSTGIWQTVWLEFVDAARIVSANYKTDFDSSSVVISVKVTPEAIGKHVKADVFFEGRAVGTAEADLLSNCTEMVCRLSEIHKWDLGEGNLYDVVFELSDEGGVRDTVKSYFGLRTVALDKKAFRLNGRIVFGRWVLDQGYYPDGIYTAPTDDDLKNDIICSMQLGFNGARLHEKIFEPRFLYWADKLGYMVWGEYPNWGLNITEFGCIENILPEWIEAVERDIAHPAIIGWCPLNETWDHFNRRQNDMLVKTLYQVTKAIDPSRPAIDTSGNYHVATDIFDVHDYTQEVEAFKYNYSETDKGILRDSVFRKTPDRQTYGGEPMFISEYGGIKWSSEEGEAWGYGNAPKTEEEFLARYEGLTTTIIDNPDMLGFCYTQLYDVEQEQNGLMTYQRVFKFDPEIIRKINTKKAAIED